RMPRRSVATACGAATASANARGCALKALIHRSQSDASNAARSSARCPDRSPPRLSHMATRCCEPPRTRTENRLIKRLARSVSRRLQKRHLEFKISPNVRLRQQEESWKNFRVATPVATQYGAV